jgi:hypothetical protein
MLTLILPFSVSNIWFLGGVVVSLHHQKDFLMVKVYG